MVKSQKGFTLIELVVVIVILGILAAVAFPKFQDMSGDAKRATVKGAIAAFQSAAVITFAKGQGAVPTFASVNTQVTSDGTFSFTGPCPTVTAVYTPDTSFNSAFTMDTGLCNN
jgi:MSHA pilin protein MshA